MPKRSQSEMNKERKAVRSAARKAVKEGKGLAGAYEEARKVRDAGEKKRATSSKPKPKMTTKAHQKNLDKMKAKRSAGKPKGVEQTKQLTKPSSTSLTSPRKSGVPAKASTASKAMTTPGKLPDRSKALAEIGKGANASVGKSAGRSVFARAGNALKSAGKGLARGGLGAAAIAAGTYAIGLGLENTTSGQKEGTGGRNTRNTTGKTPARSSAGKATARNVYAPKAKTGFTGAGISEVGTNKMTPVKASATSKKATAKKARHVSKGPGQHKAANKSQVGTMGMKGYLRSRRSETEKTRKKLGIT